MCVVGGMCGVGHVWLGAFMMGDMDSRGHAWQVGGVCGGGHVWWGHVWWGHV